MPWLVVSSELFFRVGVGELANLNLNYVMNQTGISIFGTLPTSQIQLIYKLISSNNCQSIRKEVASLSICNPTNNYTQPKHYQDHYRLTYNIRL